MASFEPHFSPDPQDDGGYEDLTVPERCVLGLGRVVSEWEVERLGRLVHELNGEDLCPELLTKFRTPQIFGQYTTQEMRVWQLVTSALSSPERPEAGVVTVGRERLGITAEAIPDFSVLGPRLRECTGWDLAGIPGAIPSDLFAQLLSQRIFPVVIGVRRPDEEVTESTQASDLRFTQQVIDTDIIQDVWAVMPLLTIQPVADFLQCWGSLGHQAYLMRSFERSVEAIEALGTLFYFTIGHGVLVEGEGQRLCPWGAAFIGGDSEFSAEKSEVTPLCFDLALEAEIPLRAVRPPRVFSLRRFTQLGSLISKFKSRFGIE